MLIGMGITLTGGLLLALVMLVCYKLLMAKVYKMKIKKITRGLPMIPTSEMTPDSPAIIGLTRHNCQKLLKWHQELGKTIGFTMGCRLGASTTDLDLIKTIVFDEPDSHLDRSEVSLPIVEIRESIMLAPKDEWRQLRKMIAPAFTSNKIKSPNVMHEMEASTKKLVDYIEKKLDNEKSDYEFNVNDFVHKYSLDMVFRCFYKQDNLVDFDDPNEHWVTSTERNFADLQKSALVKLSLIFPLLKRPLDWLVWHFSPQGEFRKKMCGFVRSQTKLGLEARKQLVEIESEAKKSGAKVDSSDFQLKNGVRFKRNMTDYILDHFLDRKMTKEQYFNNLCFLMGAADKTATDSMVHTIYNLSIHQDVQDKLRESIKTDGEESEYLDWVLKESLRLLPPAPIGCSRTITRDMEIEGGHILPAGTFVHTNAFVIHRLKEYWGEDADEFKPERWADVSKHHPCQWIPFGLGLRACPGKMFAMHKMKMFFATLLTRYKFTGKPKEDAYVFDSPLWIFVVPNSETKVHVSRL
jgi:cytochrome P450